MVKFANSHSIDFKNDQESREIAKPSLVVHLFFGRGLKNPLLVNIHNNRVDSKNKEQIFLASVFFSNNGKGLSYKKFFENINFLFTSPSIQNAQKYDIQHCSRLKLASLDRKCLRKNCMLA